MSATSPLPVCPQTGLHDPLSTAIAPAVAVLLRSGLG